MALRLHDGGHPMTRNVTMYQDEAHNGQPLPENTGNTSDDRMDIANAIGADLGIPIELALRIAERILLSKWRQESLANAWEAGWRLGFLNEGDNPYL